MISLNWFWVTVSTAMDLVASSNFGANAKPKTRNASSAACIAAETHIPSFDGSPVTRSLAYGLLVGSVTRATFLKPAAVTSPMISATRP